MTQVKSHNAHDTTPESLRRVWTLWELMNTFRAYDFCMLVRNLTWVKGNFNQLAGKPPSKDFEHTRATFLGLLERGIEFCDKVGFVDARKVLVRSLRATRTGALDASRLTGEAMHVHDAILDDIAKLSYVYVQLDFVEYLDSDRLFGEKVRQRFPKAGSDIKQAGNCLALGCSTAAVFHAMRVVEHGLRALARKVGAKLTHKGQPLQVEYADWNQVITQTKNKIIAVRAMNKGPIQDRNLAFYSDMAGQCEYMKDTWRNTICHCRRPFTQTEAKAIIERVQSYMARLATDLRSMR